MKFMVGTWFLDKTILSFSQIGQNDDQIEDKMEHAVFISERYLQKY